MAKKNFSDKDALTFAEEVFRFDANPHRQVLERTWLRNILYYLGEQWLQWYATQNTFGRRYEINVTTPTPVSNIIRDYVRSLKALTLNKSYSTSIWPNSQEQKDKDAADLGIAFLEDLDSANDHAIEDVKEEAELWRVITGNAFVRAMINGNTGKYIIGKDKIPVPEKGDVEAFCELPFNVLVPDLGKVMREKEYVATKTLVLKEWVQDVFEKKVKNPTNYDYTEVDYQKTLLTLIANVSPWKGRGLQSDDLMRRNNDYTIYKTIQFKPTVKYPKGRYVILAGDDIVYNEEVMPIPVDDKTGSWFYDITHFQYDLSPGSFWSTGGVDDLISPQNTVNRIDQALETNRDGLGRPFVLVPGDVVLKRLTSRNQGILAIKYDSRDVMGSKPVIHPGTPYPTQIIDERKIHIEQGQTAAGDPKNVLKGQAPGSGASGIMLDILRETAEQSHAPDVRRFYRGWNRVQRKRLLLAQHYYTETRMIKLKGKGNEILVKNFKGADLYGNNDIRLELDSGTSSTNAGKNFVLMDLIKSEFWGPIYQKPQVQRELLKRMGLSGFPETQNIHRDRAEYENSKLAAKDYKDIAFPGIPKRDETTGEIEQDPNTGIVTYREKPVIDPVFRVDDPLVHIQVHEQYILSREFQVLPDKVKAHAIGHLMMHQQAWEATQLERMAQEEQADAQGNEGESGQAPTMQQAQTA